MGDRKRRKKRQLEVVHDTTKALLSILKLIPSKAQTSNKNSSIDNFILHNCQDDDCDPDDDDDDEEEEEDNDEDEDKDDNSGGDNSQKRKTGQIERENNHRRL